MKASPLLQKIMLNDDFIKGIAETQKRIEEKLDTIIEQLRKQEERKKHP